jgi:uncharacterized membrane protein
MQLVVTGLPRETVLSDFLNQFVVLEHEGFIRLVDAVFVAKDAHGGMTKAELAPGSKVAAPLPGALARLLFGDGAMSAIDQINIGALAGDGGEFGLDKNAIDQIVDLIPRESLTAFVLLEHLWVDELRQLMRMCGGRVIAHGWATSETLIAMNEAHYMPGASDLPGEIWRS